jgi:glycosyltransferase involved in cell wall biosynthesis
VRHASGRPLRVGLVIGQLSTGGAEGQLALLCEGFDRATVAPTVYCLSEHTAPYGARLAAAGVPVRPITGGRVGRVAALRRRLRADGIEVVHAWLFIGNAYAWAARWRGGPVLVTSARNCKRSGRLLDWLNRRAFAGSEAIIVNSGQVRTYIEREYAAPAQRIAVVYNAIDLERFRPRTRAPAGSGPCVVMVGRLVAQKNPALFVAAAAALRRNLPTARFRWVGDGPLRPAVEAAVREAGLQDCCQLVGERNDVEELLQDADLFWLTSDWEGLPNVVLEAMACGLPVIATDVGGTAELVHPGEQGFLVRPGDREALVAHSTAVLADPALLQRMGAAARARAERFGRAAMVRDTVAVYAQALARGTR